MLGHLRFGSLILMLALIPGCGVQSVAGGTKGILRFDGQLLTDIRVEIYQVDGGSLRPIGFGVTTTDGSFQLVTNGAQGALWLAPGEYRCTLESVGPPIQVAKEYTRAETTPLVVHWTAGDQQLDLEVPTPSSSG